MSNDKKLKPDQKKNFPTTFFLFLLAVILIVITVQNFMSTKHAKVAFSHQLEHLVNLNLILPDENRKVSLNDNLVTFSGKFRDSQPEEGQRRYRYLQLLDANHRLNNALEESMITLNRLEGDIRESAHWFLEISGEPLPVGGYRVVEDTYDVPKRKNGITIRKELPKEMINLKRMQQQLNAISQVGDYNTQQELVLKFESDLAILIGSFRSPVLGIGAESMKQELKTLEKNLEDSTLSTLPLPQKISNYREILRQLQIIVNALDQPVDNIRLSELRYVRQYKEEMARFNTLSQELEQNETQLDKARAAISQVIWYFNNKELSTRALERQDSETFGHWFANAKEEIENFKYNRNLPFKAPDQPRNLVLEKTFKSQEPAPNYFNYILTLLPILLVVLLLYFVFSRQMKGMGGTAMTFGKSPAKMLQKGQNKVTFKDVAGIDEAKEELVEIVEFLKNPTKFTTLGGRIPKGVLLIGPPGCGKTMIAKAVAGEADRPFFSIAGSDFVEMFVGVGASRIRDMFDQAKKNAPCIIFIDEIDAVGRHRGAGIGGGHDEREQTLNQLLVEMDGFDTNEGVILMAATNRPDVLDKALLRPGRFDRRVVIGLPDIKGRYEILKVHARKIKIDPTVDLFAVARSTPGASGADLENLLNESALLAARKGRSAVTNTDVAEARDKVLYGKERRSLEIGEQEKKTTAYHESGHAMVGLIAEHSDPVDKVTIIPRGLSLGATHFLPEKNRLNYWKKEVLDHLAVLMGGRAAEEIFLADISSGAQQDISQATRLARSMVCEWGMSDQLGTVAYDERGDNGGGYGGLNYHEKNYSEETARAIDEEVRNLLDLAYKRAYDIIESHRKEVELMTAMLIEFETLDAQDVRDILKNEWDPEKKRKRLLEQDQLFKRQPGTPPPPPAISPEINKDDSSNLGYSPS